eukprot:12855956-Ditylum_brightwellii.AAC.1
MQHECHRSHQICNMSQDRGIISVLSQFPNHSVQSPQHGIFLTREEKTMIVRGAATADASLDGQS